MTNKLAIFLQDKIKKHGSITLDSFMNMCLTHEKWGYYTTKDNILGTEGDFLTSPEISQIFGELIGVWIYSMWLHMGSPKDCHIVELGAGRGLLMEDILRSQKNFTDFNNAKTINFVEVSSKLKEQQKQAASKYLSQDRLKWHDNLSSIPKDGAIIFIANEFFDALPVKHFIKLNNKWYERKVSLNANDDFTWHHEEIPFMPNHKAAYSANNGDIVEISEPCRAVAKEIVELTANRKTAGLIIDYGYVNHMLGETLQALREHKYVDIFSSVGKSDLTAHVNFQELKEIFTDAKLNCTICTQREFLLQLGIEQRYNMLKANCNKQQEQALTNGVNRLIDEKQMGSLFKVLTFTNC